MKKHSYLIYMLTASLLISVSSLVSSCKDDEPGVVEKNKKLLTSGTWTISNVTVDGANENDLFTGFTLAFNNDGSFVTTNGTPVWSNSGAWQFSDGTGKTLTRDDDVVVSITTLTETALTLTLSWDKTTLGNGRTRSVSGAHIFEFSK
jgi:hypothetical protein